MQTTRKNTLLIVLFVVVFAVTFVLGRLQATGKSVQPHPPATSTAVQWGFSSISASYQFPPRVWSLANLTEKRELHEE